jgi:hypothetical protein
MINSIFIISIIALVLVLLAGGVGAYYRIEVWWTKVLSVIFAGTLVAIVIVGCLQVC